LQSGAATATSAAPFIRNDTPTEIINAQDNQTLAANAFDNADHVLGVTDSGSSLQGYLDGVAGTARSYTRSGTLTLDRFALFALLRTSAGSFFAGRVYAVVVVNRVIDTGERAALTTYLGAKAGLSI
jgi:hypothetical protein